MRGLEHDWQNIHTVFCFQNLSRDFIRELVGTNKVYRKNLELELMMDIHGWAIHASAFYKNMYCYLEDRLALEKQLHSYVDMVYEMYKEQVNKACEMR